MKKLACLLGWLMAFVLLVANPALAQTQTFTNPDNGHQYFLTQKGAWTDAKATAEAAGGKLVIVNDQREQDWLLKTFGTTELFWIGLTDEKTEGNFQWVTGENPAYTNWNPGEPNNGKCHADEHYIAINWSGNGGWNDLNNQGYWQDCTGKSKFCDTNIGASNLPSDCVTGFQPIAGIVEIEPKLGEIRGTKSNDLNGDGILSNEPGLSGVTIFLDLNNNAVLDSGEPTQVTDGQGQYKFTGLQPGNYIVRELAPTGFRQTFPVKGTTVRGDGFADEVLEFFNSGAGPIPGPYGSKGGRPRVVPGYIIEPVSPNVVLGPPPPSPVISQNSQVDWLALPKGTFVTVGFNDERVIDSPGNDIFIRSFDPQDSARELADIFVSANGTDFQKLGTILENGVTKLDLATIGFTQPVKVVKVLGLDTLGASPGFDLIGVEALPGSIGNPDFHTIPLAAGQVVENINFGNTQQ